MDHIASAPNNYPLCSLYPYREALMQTVTSRYTTVETARSRGEAARPRTTPAAEHSCTPAAPLSSIPILGTASLTLLSILRYYLNIFYLFAFYFLIDTFDFI